VKARRRITEDPCGNGLGPQLSQVEQPSQCVGVRHSEIVRGQHPDRGTAIQGIQQTAINLLKPRLHDEADQQIHVVKPRITKAPQQVITQQPILPIHQCVRSSLRLQVGALARYDVPDTTARVWRIAVVTRNDVDVQVANSLPGRRTLVEANVVAVRPQLCIKLPLDLIDQSQHVSSLLVSSLPPGSDHPSRHHEGVPRADRKAISNDKRGIVSQEPLGGRDRQIWRVTVRHPGSTRSRVSKNTVRPLVRMTSTYGSPRRSNLAAWPI